MHDHKHADMKREKQSEMQSDKRVAKSGIKGTYVLVSLD
jgi:hypothetical protein